LQFLPVLWSIAANLLIPFAANTRSFTFILVISKLLSFFPLIIPSVLPVGFGTTHSHPHNVHRTYTTLFKTISVFSFLLHSKESVQALVYNAPGDSYHRHSLLHPFKTEHRSVLNRGSTAVGRVLGAVGDHPAVNAVGWDVLLSGLSTGLWSAVRGFDVHDLFACSVPFYGRAEKTLDGSVNGTEKSEHGVKT
jgi:hypothetical protein